MPIRILAAQVANAISDTITYFTDDVLVLGIVGLVVGEDSTIDTKRWKSGRVKAEFPLNAQI